MKNGHHPDGVCKYTIFCLAHNFERCIKSRVGSESKWGCACVITDHSSLLRGSNNFLIAKGLMLPKVKYLPWHRRLSCGQKCNTAESFSPHRAVWWFSSSWSRCKTYYIICCVVLICSMKGSEKEKKKTSWSKYKLCRSEFMQILMDLPVYVLEVMYPPAPELVFVPHNFTTRSNVMWSKHFVGKKIIYLFSCMYVFVLKADLPSFDVFWGKSPSGCRRLRLVLSVWNNIIMVN